MNPLAAPFTLPARVNTTRIFAADDADIRDNIRYRLYDCIFDIEYDEDPSPLVMQYIRIFDPPPHPLFHRESWTRTMVHHPWSHAPRGFNLFLVSRKVGWEAWFRFYWFHFPNHVLPRNNWHDLRNRLSKVPKLHIHSVNALLKFCRRGSNHKIADPKAIYLHYGQLMRFVVTKGLDVNDAPWVRRLSSSNKDERIILGPGFQISQSIGAKNLPETLWFAGKLGNMKFYPNHPKRLDFTDTAYWILRQHHQAFQQRKSAYLKNAIDHISNSIEQLSAPTSDPGQVSAMKAQAAGQKAESSSETATEKTNENRLQTMGLNGDNETSSKGTLRGGEIYDRTCSAASDRIALITRLLQVDSKGSKSSRENEELLTPVAVRRFTYALQLPNTDMVTGIPQSTPEHTQTHRTKLLSEIGIGNEGSDAKLHRHGFHLDGSIFSQSTNLALSRRTASACVRGSGSKETSESLQRQHQQTDRKPEQDFCPIRRSTGDRASSEDSHLHTTSKMALESSHSRESSFEYRISQWIQREKSPETPTRKSSSSSWLDKEEARALSARKRVTSSSYHTCLSHRSTHRYSSSGTLCSAAPFRSSVKDAAEEPLAQPTNPILATTTAANTIIQYCSQQQQDTSSDNSDPTSPTCPNPADSPPPDNTNALASQTPEHRPSPSPSPRRLSTSSNLADADADADDKRDNKADDDGGMADVGDGALLLPGDDVPLLLPGVKQFLTPKRDARAWWEAGGGDDFGQSQSTGGKAKVKGKGRRRETRGSASSWISYD